MTDGTADQRPLIGEISTLVDRLDDLENPRSETGAASFARLLETLTLASEDRVGDELPVRPELEPLRRRLSGAWRRHLAALEQMAAVDASSAHSPLAVEGYTRLDAEAGLLRARNHDRVVLVGCGPCPETAVALARLGVGRGRFVAVDADAHAVHLARGFVCAVGEPGIVVEDADGRDYDYGDADVVFVANGVTGKHEVLEQARRTAPPGAGFVVREPVGLGVLVYEEVDVEELRMRVVGAVRPSPLSRTTLMEAVPAG